MNYRNQYKALTVMFRGIEVVLQGVTFYPAVQATEIDPPEAPFAEWDSVSIGGVEVQELFHGKLGEELEDEVIGQLEAA